MVDLAAVRAAVAEGWRRDADSRPGGAWLALPGAVAHATGLPAAQWNGVHQLEAGADVAPARELLEGLRVPWGLLVPAELGLRPAGFAPLHEQPLMARRLPAPGPAWPTGVEVRDDAPAEDVAAVQAAAFGDPVDLTLAFVAPQVGAPWARFLTAYDGDVPVGTAQVVLAGESAGVYGVAVGAGWRRRGLGAALTSAATGLAAQAGLPFAHLNPSEEGRSVYAALGFTDLPPWAVWSPAYLA